MVACMGSVADPAIDAGIAEAWRQVGADQQIINARTELVHP